MKIIISKHKKVSNECVADNVICNHPLDLHHQKRELPLYLKQVNQGKKVTYCNTQEEALFAELVLLSFSVESSQLEL